MCFCTAWPGLLAGSRCASSSLYHCFMPCYKCGNSLSRQIQQQGSISRTKKDWPGAFQLKLGSCLMMSYSTDSVTKLLATRVLHHKLGAMSSCYKAFLLTMQVYYSLDLGSCCMSSHITHVTSDSLSWHSRKLSHSLCTSHSCDAN